MNIDPKWNEPTTVVYLGCGHVRSVKRIVNREGAATFCGLCDLCFDTWNRQHGHEVLAAWEAHIKDGGD